MWFIRFSSLLLLFCIVIPGLSQDKKEDKPPEPTLETFIEAKIPVANKHLLFLVDTSGSMDGFKVMKAISTVIELCQAPVDDFQVAAISFGSHPHKWPGTEDIDPDTKVDVSPPGWSLMPSETNLKILDSWLNKNRDSGSTDFSEAIDMAFSEVSSIKDVSIVIISDCDFDQTAERAAELVSFGQKSREDNKMPPATIGIFGIDVPSNERINGALSIKEATSKYFSPLIQLGFYNFKYPQLPPPDTAPQAPTIDPPAPPWPGH